MDLERGTGRGYSAMRRLIKDANRARYVGRRASLRWNSGIVAASQGEDGTAVMYGLKAPAVTPHVHVHEVPTKYSWCFHVPGNFMYREQKILSWYPKDRAGKNLIAGKVQGNDGDGSRARFTGNLM
jgi:hypothetical protein